MIKKPSIFVISAVGMILATINSGAAQAAAMTPAERFQLSWTLGPTLVGLPGLKADMEALLDAEALWAASYPGMSGSTITWRLEQRPAVPVALRFGAQFSPEFGGTLQIETLFPQSVLKAEVSGGSGVEDGISGVETIRLHERWKFDASYTAVLLGPSFQTGKGRLRFIGNLGAGPALTRLTLRQNLKLDDRLNATGYNYQATLRMGGFTVVGAVGLGAELRTKGPLSSVFLELGYRLAMPAGLKYRQDVDINGDGMTDFLKGDEVLDSAGDPSTVDMSGPLARLGVRFSFWPGVTPK